MLLLAFLVATWVATSEMRRRGLAAGLGPALGVAAMLGGVAGGRVYWALEHGRFASTALSGGLLGSGGLSYYGAFLGAAVAIGGVCRLYGVPLGQAANCYAVAIPPAYILARLGCFLAGDDYGTPTTLPWGMAFPLGSPPTLELVHPTQLYEILLTLPAALILWGQRRRIDRPWRLLWWCCLLTGTERFVVEFWRTNPDVALGATAAQWISLGLMGMSLAGLGLQRDGNPLRRIPSAHPRLPSGGPRALDRKLAKVLDRVPGPGIGPGPHGAR